MEQRRTALAVVISLGALLLAAPRPSAAVALLSGATGSPDPTGPVVAAVALLAWAVTAWLALTVVLVVLSRLPGLLGRTVGALAGRIAPAAVRRAVEAALGLTVAVGVLVPTAALAAPVAAPPAAVGLSGDAGWDLDWPGGPPASAGPASTTAPSVPPRTPATATPTRPPRLPAASAGAPAAPPPAPPTRPATAPPHPVTVPPAPASVVVRSGDSLWSVAEAALRRAGAAATDRQVAQAWPRWWAANREAVGDDPDLLLPGTVLRPPPDVARS